MSMNALTSPSNSTDTPRRSSASYQLPSISAHFPPAPPPLSRQSPPEQHYYHSLPPIQQHHQMFPQQQPQQQFYPPPPQPPLSPPVTYRPSSLQHAPPDNGFQGYLHQQQHVKPPPPPPQTRPTAPPPQPQPQPVAQKQLSPTPNATPANQIPPGGAPARRFLNDNVTPALLEGMKMLAREQPKEPLLALARFLEERHKELEQKGDDVKMEDVNGANS
jgi:COMPASS component SDC1